MFHPGLVIKCVNVVLQSILDIMVYLWKKQFKINAGRWTAKGLNHTYTCNHSPPNPPSHPGWHITLSKVPSTLLTGYTPIQNVFGIKKNKLIKIKFKQKLININGKNQWNQKLFLYKDFLKIDKPLVKLITTTTNKRYKLLI